MATLKEDLDKIKTVEDTLTKNKVSRFAYTEKAYNDDDADGVDVYNVEKEQNIPNASPETMKVNQTVVNKGYRAQASSITRMLLNHFLGRISYNLNKVNDNMGSLLGTLQSHLGKANGIASLDENGRVPYSQLPESAMELKGEWNAETNTPTLKDGVGNNGDFYIVNVQGTQTFGEEEISFNVNDRIIYNGETGKWVKLSAGSVLKVCNVSPDASGNVTLNANNVGAISSTDKGVANGVATLDETGKVSSSQIPTATGTVKKVCNVSPDANGNVTLNATNVGALASSAKGTANGVASLDANTKVPEAQLPSSLVKKVNNVSPDASGNVTLNANNVGAIATSSKGVAGGVASLDNSGKVTESQLPSSIVKKVCNVSPDTNGNIALNANNIGAVPLSSKGVANGVASLDKFGYLPVDQMSDEVLTEINGLVGGNYSIYITGDDIDITKGTVSAPKLLTPISILDNAQNHNAIWGGRNLGDKGLSVDVVCGEINKKGYCEGVYVGDYWVFNGVTFRIVEFDSFYNQRQFSGYYYSNNGYYHHAVVMADINITGNIPWNNSETINNGYIGSTIFNALKTIASSWTEQLSRRILTTYAYFSSACSYGQITGTQLTGASMFLPSCIELFGNPTLDENLTNATIKNCYITGATHQFSAFRLNPSLIWDTLTSYWLIDPYATDSPNAAEVLFVDRENKKVSKQDVRNICFIRPFFCIG